jgi:hydrogenase maturation protease
MKLLIIGYGNPLRQDDGLGPRAIDLLIEEPGLPAGTALLACQQLTPELSYRLAEAERVILIDALAPGSHPAFRQPGAVHAFPIAPDAHGATLLNHSLAPAALLGLTQVLFGRAPATQIFLMEAASFALEEGLTPAVSAALPGLVACVLAAAQGTPCARAGDALGAPVGDALGAPVGEPALHPALAMAGV